MTHTDHTLTLNAQPSLIDISFFYLPPLHAVYGQESYQLPVANQKFADAFGPWNLLDAMAFHTKLQDLRGQTNLEASGIRLSTQLNGPMFGNAVDWLSNVTKGKRSFTFLHMQSTGRKVTGGQPKICRRLREMCISTLQHICLQTFFCLVLLLTRETKWVIFQLAMLLGLGIPDTCGHRSFGLRWSKASTSPTLVASRRNVSITSCGQHHGKVSSTQDSYPPVTQKKDMENPP